MRKKVTANWATVGYSGRVGYLANIHNYGLQSWVGFKKNRRKIKMPKRDILGITEKDLNMIESEFLEVISKS